MHQTGLGVTQRSLREALSGGNLLALEPVALLHGGQTVGVLAVGLLFVVGRLAVDLKETVEHHHLAAGHEVGVAVVNIDGGCGFLYLCVGHLRGDGTLPDEVVESALLRGPLLSVQVGERRADGLMRLLSALRMGLELTRTAVLLAVVLDDFLLAGTQGERGEMDAVGTHVGDASALVKTLGNDHCLRHREAELASGLLLQRGGGERWCGLALERFLRHAAHAEMGALALIEEGHHLVVGLEAAVELSLHLTRGAVGVVEQEHGADAVERLTLEMLYLALALDDELHHDALHASGRERRLHLTPQHRRELEAHDAVEHAAGLLRVDEVHVEMARMLYGLKDGGLRNLVEDDARGLLLVQSQHLTQMPADGFSLAVFIGCEPDLLGGLRVLLQVGDDLLLLFGYLINGAEVLLINAQFLFLQVADVPVRRHHLIVLAQEFSYLLGLGRTLYNH